MEAQLLQQLAEVWRLHAEKERREWEARERAKWEAQEKECWENEYQARYQEEQRWKHEAAAQQVAEAKMIQRQVRMLETYGSRRNGDLDVSSPSPSPVYIRLIQKQAARVSCSETERNILLMETETGKSWGPPEGPLWRLHRTARHPVMGAGNGRSCVTFPGGSHVG